ncbi:MAG: NAD(P)-dependent oxidoreductase, partial [Deltaproteobacteria bacterium]|nr:NAD(P)-dependent oxidoreductase [Nannocystaceae bacterium]
GALVVLVSGHPDAIERAREPFAAYASAVHPMGAAPHATIAKLAVNALFAAQVAMLGELLPAAQVQGVDPGALMELLGSLPVLSPAAKAAGLGMNADRFGPMFPVALVAKDLRQAVLDRADRMPITDALRALFERGETSGLGTENLTAIVKLARA